MPTDSPSQVELSDGMDGQVEAEQVAVGVVLVGAAERFTGQGHIHNHLYRNKSVCLLTRVQLW